MNDETMDHVLYALSHTTRRKVLDIVKANPGCIVNEVAKHFDCSRVAIMKHLGILEQAKLIISEKQGRSRRLYMNLTPIQMIYDRWTDEYSAFWSGQLMDIKYKVEKTHER